MSNLPADERLAELREHIALNFTTDARVAIAWAAGEIERLNEALQRAHGYWPCPECDDSQVTRRG